MAIHTAHSWVECLRTFITLSFVFTYSVSFFFVFFCNANVIPFLFFFQWQGHFIFFNTCFQSFVTGHHFFISFLFSTVHRFFCVVCFFFFFVIGYVALVLHVPRFIVSTSCSKVYYDCPINFLLSHCERWLWWCSWCTSTCNEYANLWTNAY